MKEIDLFRPVAQYLLEQGYTVRSEVRDCDITAVKGEHLIIVELKLNFSVDLLIQATARQQAADAVYVAIPRPKKGLRGKHWLGVVRLVKRLELGLLLVKGERVEVVTEPRPYTPLRKAKTRTAILKEISGRSQDYNVGGSSGVPLLTAYRENAVQIALLLKTSGPLSAKQLRALGTGDKTHDILYNDHYGWFLRVDRGIYGITEKGDKEVQAYPELVELYSQSENDSCQNS